MNEDIIYRQAAINAATYGNPQTAWQRIEALPSAEPEQRWIPVTERMPEEYQKAICTNKHNEMMIGTYTKYGWMFPCYFETPIAWMPLPEPWKGDEE